MWIITSDAYYSCITLKYIQKAFVRFLLIWEHKAGDGMKGYLSIANEEEEEVQVVAVENEVGFYRGEDIHIFVETEDGEHELGVRDISVSSRRSDGSPIVIRSNEGALSIHNVDNKNPITVRSLRNEIELSKTESTDVTDDCLIELGFAAEVLLTVEDIKSGSETIDAPELDGAGGEIPVQAFVSLLCEHFRRAAHESKSETQRRAQQLLDAVSEHPAEVAGFESARKRLEDELAKMKRMERGAELATDGKFKDEERIQGYESLAHRFEDLYKRSERSNYEKNISTPG